MTGSITCLQGRLASRSTAKDKGSILLVALWSLCILVIFAVMLGYTVRQKLTLVERLNQREKLRLIAEAGVKKAIAQLKKEPENTYNTLKDDWSNNTAIFKDMHIGDGVVDICYDHLDGRTAASETTVYGLIDEERKININKIDMVVLERLFRVVLHYNESNAQSLAASIVDWRDADSQLSIPLGSAEDPYYKNLSYPYEAKDREFEIPEELLLVRGMDKDIFEKIKNYITIYGNGKININTASKTVLLALGLNRDLAEKIISFRLGEDGLPGSFDDNVFEAAANITSSLSQFSHLSASEIVQVSAVVDKYLTVNSDNFMIRSMTRLNKGGNSSESISVVDREGKILYWRGS